MKILWPVGASSEALYVARIAQVLQRQYQAEIVLLTPFKSSQITLAQSGYACLHLGELLEQVRADLPSNAEEQISKANEVLDRIDINLLLHADSLLFYWDNHQVARLFIAQMVLALAAFMRKQQFQMCIGYFGGNVLVRAAGILSESMHLPVYGLLSGTYWDTCVLVEAGLREEWDWRSFHDHWQERQGRKIDQAEKRELDERIAALSIASQSTPRLRVEQLGIIKRNALLRKAADLRAGIRFKRLTAGIDPDKLMATGDMDMLLPAWDRHYFEVQAEWANTYPKFVYDPMPDSFVYMPLSMAWDSPHRADHPMNYLQEYTARVVSASLPAGYELVVKEHPYTHGDPNHAALRELQRLGIRVIEPHIHSHEVIQKAKAVFCLGETTGWEAIMFKTPVVVYGAHPFYLDYPHVQEAHDPNTVHNALRQALRLGDRAYQDEDLWYSFLNCAFESCHPGNIWAYKTFLWSELDKSEENIQKISRMVAKEAHLDGDPAIGLS